LEPVVEELVVKTVGLVRLQVHAAGWKEGGTRRDGPAACKGAAGRFTPYTPAAPREMPGRFSRASTPNLTS
jgi:hypothetical protein